MSDKGIIQEKTSWEKLYKRVNWQKMKLKLSFIDVIFYAMKKWKLKLSFIDVMAWTE